MEDYYSQPTLHHSQSPHSPFPISWRLVLTRSLIAILIAATLAAMASMAMGAVMAHEDREAGGYKLVVGFMDEPAYEGERNAVSLRVTKEAGGDHEESSGMAGMDMSSGHQGETSRDTVESEVPVNVSLMTEVEEDGGVNVHIMTDGWTWSLGGAGQHVPGEGHGHIYVDGELLRMVYEPVNHLSGLAPGDRHVRVALSSRPDLQRRANRVRQV